MHHLSETKSKYRLSKTNYPSQRFYINSSVNDLTKDIKETSDPLRKVILQKFLDIKIQELRSIQEDPSIEGLSDDDTSNESVNTNDQEKNNNKNETKYEKNKKELEAIFKKQNESLSELEKANKMKAYAEILSDNQRESDQETLEKVRGKAERAWSGAGATYDPKYINFAKDDSMNNKMMERLNSEIEFRCDEENRQKKPLVERPFDDGDADSTEMYAKYEQNENNTISSKSKGKSKYHIQKRNKPLGQRISYY
jgi:hypothetical protein